MTIVEGKIAVITGAASGIGAEVSQLFHDNGALLVLSDVAERVFQVAEELGDRAIAIQGDVSKSADATRMIDQAVSSYGGIDILCTSQVSLAIGARWRNAARRISSISWG